MMFHHSLSIAARLKVATKSKNVRRFCPLLFETMLEPEGFGGFASEHSQRDAQRISLTDFEMGMDSR